MMIYERFEYEEGTSLNEAYIGKTPNIGRMEDALTRVMNVNKLQGAAEAMKCSAMQEFTNAICDQFGFVDAVVTIIPSAIINAFTFPVDINSKILRERDDIIFYDGKKGLSFNKKYKFKFRLVLYSKIMEVTTPAQLMSAVLHEIGHSFKIVTSFYQTGWVGQIIDKYLVDYIKDDKISADKNDSLTEIFKLATKMISALPKSFQSIIKIYLLLHKVDSLYLSLKDLFKNNALKNIGNIAYNGLLTAGGSRTSSGAMQGMSGLGAEYFSDSFAAMYGYGADAATAFERMERTDTLIENILGIMTMPYRLVSNVTHPDAVSRVLNIIAQYEKTIATEKSLTKEQKEFLKEQIEQAKKTVERMQTLDFKSKKVSIFSAAISKLLHSTILSDRKEQLYDMTDYDFGIMKNDKIKKTNMKK